MQGTIHEFSTDETTFRTGDKVRHVHYPLIRGKITKMTIPLKGGGVTRVCVDPESVEALQQMMKLGHEWPTQGGGRYVQMRDTGLPAWKWKHV